MEWHEWNGKNGMAEMEAGGLECLVYRIVHSPQAWEARIFKGLDIHTTAELCLFFIFFKTLRVVPPSGEQRQ